MRGFDRFGSFGKREISALVLIFGLMSAAEFSCSNSSESGIAVPGTPISSIAVSGQNTFADGTPIASKNVQYQLIMDGANLFHPGPGGCRETPAHVAGTVIGQLNTDASGEYSVRIPVNSLTAAVMKQCSILALGSGQVTGLKIKASILADASSCPAYCAAQGDPSASCVNDCSTGNRTIEATQSLSGDQLLALIQGMSQSTIQWLQNLTFSSLGPALSLGSGPDLRVDLASAQSSAHITEETFAADSCEVAESCVRAAGLRRVLRFDGTIQNLGSSDLVLGNPNGSAFFQQSSCHHVPLLSSIMLYELIDPQTGQTVQVGGQDVVGRKQGFCMMDTTQVNASAPQGQYSCDNQGITAGWADVYDSSLECQFLDITDVPPGDYTLRLTVNPDGLFQESDTSNNAADVPVTIPPR